MRSAIGKTSYVVHNWKIKFKCTTCMPLCGKKSSTHLIRFGQENDHFFLVASILGLTVDLLCHSYLPCCFSVRSILGLTWVTLSFLPILRSSLLKKMFLFNATNILSFTVDVLCYSYLPGGFLYSS